MPSDTVYHGSCLCGSIKYEVTGEPFTFYICHCNNCRKMTGSAFMSNAFFRPNQVVVSRGKDKLGHYRDTDTAKGGALMRSFCPKCGSSLFVSNPTNNTYTIVAVGTIDDKVDWAPRRESFPERRRHWVTGLHFVPKLRTKL